MYLDLGTGRLRIAASAPGDDCCPYVAAGSLYWTHNDPRPEVAVLPIAGGEPHRVADHGFLPRWSPDGRQIAFTRAYYRLSDYGLDMDGWVVGVDKSGQITSPAKSWIAGFGEDMGPVWSPDGRWVAYHSHRSATAVPLYESPGRTDDEWLRLAAGGPEIRLTDFGFEVGPPDWAPDGRRILFDSWDRDGVPRFAKPWIVTIDPATGRSIATKRMPLPPEVAGVAGEAWSPRGDEIAFIARIDDARRALWVSHADGGAHKVVDFPSYTIGGVAWTPDGQELLYSALVDDRMQNLRDRAHRRYGAAAYTRRREHDAPKCIARWAPGRRVADSVAQRTLAHDASVIVSSRRRSLPPPTVGAAAGRQADRR